MKNKPNSKIIIIVALVIFGLASFTYALYYKTTNTDKKSKEMSDVTAEKSANTKNTVDNLKKILFVEEDGKEPAIATIVDPEKVKKSNPDFYKNVEKDDMLVVYPSRAIIYRENKNQIINIAPIVSAPSVDGIKTDSLIDTSIQTNTKN